MSDIIIPAVPGKENHQASHVHHASHPVHHASVHRPAVKQDPVFDEVEKILRLVCIVSLTVYFIAVIVLSIMTDSDLFSTMLGLSPLLLTIVVTYILVDRYHMESGFLMVFPFIFTGILLVLGAAGLLDGMDYLTLASVNIILGLLFEAILVILYSYVHKVHFGGAEAKHEETKHETPTINLEDDESVKKLVATIEDKAKAINASIGRVYSVRKGGTESLRKTIRINPANYNDFNDLKGKDKDARRLAAVTLISEIKMSLDLLSKPESEVLDPGELSRLVRLKRDGFGQDKIITVLANNDADPVKQYYDGAVEFCDSTLKALGVSIHKYKGLERLDIS